MARWFEEKAKSAARRDVSPSPREGVTRRTVLTRGAAVAGMAWTAPLLMQTRAYAGVSACTSTQFGCPGPNGSFACCNKGDTCTTLNGLAYCAPPLTTGGSCGNMGQGNCTTSKCNGNTKACNDCAKPNICGGEGAYCDSTAPCAGGLTCTSIGTTGGGSHCRLMCKVNTDCNSGQFCNSDNFCAQSCVLANTTCPAGEICQPDGKLAFYCSYSQPA